MVAVTSFSTARTKLSLVKKPPMPPRRTFSARTILACGPTVSRTSARASSSEALSNSCEVKADHPHSFRTELSVELVHGQHGQVRYCGVEQPAQRRTQTGG